MTRYYYSDHLNQPIGPLTLDELKNLYAAGTLRPETQIAEEGGTTWKPYSTVLSQALSGIVPNLPPPHANNPKSVGFFRAFLWAFLCCPVGFHTFGQTGKAFAWMGISILTWGIGWIPALVDYAMCYGVQQKRPLRPWEFFPTK